jgi:hypothetical protein
LTVVVVVGETKVVETVVEVLDVVGATVVVVVVVFEEDGGEKSALCR